MVSGVELTYNSNATAMQMANTIFGNGTTVNSASYTGWSGSSAIYSNGDAISPDTTPGNAGVILSTGRASDFTNQGGGSNDSPSTTTNTSGFDNLAQFNAIAGHKTYDASFLDVNFTPTNDVLTIQFVFSSDEYPEFSNSIYNDVFAVWVNGTHVPLSVTQNAATVTQINQTSNINLFKDNTSDQFNTEMDGFTVSLTLTMPVNAGVPNDIRIGVADTSDANYDSNVLIAEGSVQSILIAEQDDIQMFNNGTGNLAVLANDINLTGGSVKVTHINGVEVVPGDSVTLATGQIVTLNPNMTFTIQNDGDLETVSFTYGILAEDEFGNDLEDDVGFVTIEIIPCFVAGTMIATPQGPRAVDALAPGDLVMTRDDGAQPVRWAGARTVAAQGSLAPVAIRAGTYGDHGDLMVSPQHRVMIRDAVAELLFGEAEVLVKAKDLVNGDSVRIVEGGEVTYVHLLFDRHQVIWSEGLATESFLPGPATTRMMERGIVDEICAIFPELDPLTGAGYSAAARPTLRHFEARLLVRAA